MKNRFETGLYSLSLQLGTRWFWTPRYLDLKNNYLYFYWMHSFMYLLSFGCLKPPLVFAPPENSRMIGSVAMSKTLNIFKGSVHSTREKFENFVSTLKKHQLFSVHTGSQEYFVVFRQFNSFSLIFQQRYSPFKNEVHQFQCDKLLQFVYTVHFTAFLKISDAFEYIPKCCLKLNCSL